MTKELATISGAGDLTAEGRREPGLRILMVAPQPFFRVRGTPFSVLHRIRALLKLGHTVDLVTYPFGEEVALQGLTLHRTGRLPGVNDVRIGPSVSKLLLDVPLFVKAYRLARTGRFDLLHTHEEAGAMGAWISRSCDLPHLYDMHSSLPQQFDNFGRFNWGPVVRVFQGLEEYTLGGADGVIAICQELADHVAASGYPGPVEMIENTLDLPAPRYDESDETQLRGQLGLTEEDRVLLYTGTFEPYQGLPLLIRAMPRVVEDEPAARLVLVGGTEGEIESLGREARKMGVEESVILVPKVPPEKVFLFHRIAHVLVTTRTRGTNTPLKIYQYLRAGLPIVATDIESHTQVLSGETAELVAPKEETIAEGLLRILNDPDRAQSLADTAQRLAQREYSEEAYMEKLATLLERMALTSSPSKSAA